MKFSQRDRDAYKNTYLPLYEKKAQLNKMREKPLSLPEFVAAKQVQKALNGGKMPPNVSREIVRNQQERTLSEAREVKARAKEEGFDLGSTRSLTQQTREETFQNLWRQEKDRIVNNPILNDKLEKKTQAAIKELTRQGRKADYNKVRDHELNKMARPAAEAVVSG